MDLSQAFAGFLAIVKESIQILPKNWRCNGSIFVISQLLTTMLYLQFVGSLQFVGHVEDRITVVDSIDYLRMLLYFLFFAVEALFLLFFIAISHFSSVATILVFSKSYTGEILSLGIILSSLKRSCRRSVVSNSLVLVSGGNSTSTRYLPYLLIPAIILVFSYPNFITLFVVVVVGIIVLALKAYSLVVSLLLIVMSVVDDDIQGEAAREKAEKLAGGRRLQVAMISLFFQLPFAIILLGFWPIWWQKESVNQMIIYGLFCFNVFCWLKMAEFAVYTLLYFQCKKEQDEKGETIEMGRVKLLSGYYPINTV